MKRKHRPGAQSSAPRVYSLVFSKCAGQEEMLPDPIASRVGRENSKSTAGWGQISPTRVKMLLHVALWSRLGKRGVSAPVAERDQRLKIPFA
jgi:hypothetical protein